MRNEEIREYLKNIYIPVAARETYMRLLDILQENTYREISSIDEGKILHDSLIIETKGKGERETFQNYTIARVDVGKVGDTYIDIAIYNIDSQSFYPIRVKKDTIKISVLNQ